MVLRNPFDGKHPLEVNRVAKQLAGAEKTVEALRLRIVRGIYNDYWKKK